MLLYTDAICLKHQPGIGHPESPERLNRTLESFRQSPPLQTKWAPIERAVEQDVMRVHAPSYVQHIANLRGQQVAIDADTVLSPHSVDAALIAAGGGLTALRAIDGGADSSAFILARPPGHHAEAASGMGFCVFNHIAVAAAYALEVLSYERILVIDWDVHHGNATQHMFENDPRVLFVSLHQSPFYPGTGMMAEVGKNDGTGYTVNIPLQAGCNDADYCEIFRHLIGAAAEAYGPELILVSAGYDAHEADPLGGMKMSSQGFGRLAREVREIADQFTDGKTVFFFEGGYHPTAVEESIRQTIDVFLGNKEATGIETSRIAFEVLQDLKTVHGPHLLGQL